MVYLFCVLKQDVIVFFTLIVESGSSLESRNHSRSLRQRECNIGSGSLDWKRGETTQGIVKWTPGGHFCPRQGWDWGTMGGGRPLTTARVPQPYLGPWREGLSGGSCSHRGDHWKQRGRERNTLALPSPHPSILGQHLPLAKPPGSRRRGPGILRRAGEEQEVSEHSTHTPLSSLFHFIPK